MISSRCLFFWDFFHKASLFGVRTPAIPRIAWWWVLLPWCCLIYNTFQWFVGFHRSNRWKDLSKAIKEVNSCNMFGHTLIFFVKNILQNWSDQSAQPTWDSTGVRFCQALQALQSCEEGTDRHRIDNREWQEFRGKTLNILVPYHYLSLVITTDRHLSLPIFEPRARPCSSPGAARESWRVPCSCGAPVVGDGGIIGASAISLRGPRTSSVPCGGVHRGGGELWLDDVRCWCGIERLNHEILIWFLVWLL